MKQILIKKSKIHGKGVFANKGFKKGEVVIKWDMSHTLTKKEAEKLPKEEKRHLVYFRGKYILMKSPSRYLNHSCEPNTTANNFSDIAKRDIKKGEEMTGNYSEYPIPGEKIICKCGSKRCRGVIKHE